jgi:serine/threonine protein kinase
VLTISSRAQQIGDTLGKGAFGTVFRGLNIKTGEVVAIKQIEKKLIREDQMPQIMVPHTPQQLNSDNNCYFNYVGLDTCETSSIYLLYSIYLFSFLIIC